MTSWGNLHESGRPWRGGVRRVSLEVAVLIVVFLVGSSLLPSATYEQPSFPRRPPDVQPPVALDLFRGPAEPGIFLLYTGGQCPEGYLLRVADLISTDVWRLWDLWRSLRTNASELPPGMTIEFHGFPYMGPTGWGPIEAGFQGAATEVLFRTSPTARDFIDFKYEVVPTGDSALVSDSDFRPLTKPPPWFWLGGNYCA